MRLRFTTATQVFEAFPAARDDIGHEPLPMSPFDFVTVLQNSQTPEDAIGFCAYMLSKVDAVAWACKSLRTIFVQLDEENEKLVQAAEAWCEHPDESSRQQALASALEAGNRGPPAWAALAAGWSGGSLTQEPQAPVPPPAHLTAQAVRAAILTAIALQPIKARRQCLERSLQIALSIADVR